MPQVGNCLFFCSFSSVDLSSNSSHSSCPSDEASPSCSSPSSTSDVGDGVRQEQLSQPPRYLLRCQMLPGDDASLLRRAQQAPSKARRSDEEVMSDEEVLRRSARRQHSSSFVRSANRHSRGYEAYE